MMTLHLDHAGAFGAANRRHRFWPLKTISLWLALALAIGLLLLVPAGCTQAPAPAPASGDVSAISENSSFEAAAHRPPTAPTLFAMARILEIQGRDEQACRVLDDIVLRYPKFLPVYCDLADLHVRHRQIGLAIHTLNAGLKLSPHDGILLNDRGMCRLLRKEYPRALKDFTLAAACQPTNTRYRSNMAMTLGLMGHYRESLSVYLLILSPADAHHNLGVICDARHDTAQAAHEFELASKLAGD